MWTKVVGYITVGMFFAIGFNVYTARYWDKEWRDVGTTTGCTFSLIMAFIWPLIVLLLILFEIHNYLVKCFHKMFDWLDAVKETSKKRN